jgi:hypothetical protein
VGTRGQIVIAVGHSETALQEIRIGVGGVCQSLGDPNAEEVLGFEVGVVQRVDIGTQLAAECA